MIGSWLPRLLCRIAGPASALALLLPGAASAAAARWQAWAESSFQHVTTANGLPNEGVIAVTEDGEGFIWVGTLGGVARWDGHEFRNYRFEPGRPGSLPDNLVQLLHRDPRGRLWIGTSAAGLARFDAATQRFETLGAGPRGISHVSVRAVVDDGEGGLWVGTDGGLDHVAADARSVRNVPLGADAASGLPGDRVVALLRDSRGRLWAGTPRGLFRRDPGRERFEHVPLRPASSGSDAVPQPESLLQDSAGRVWVGTARDGAFVLEADGSPPRPVHENALAPGTRPLNTQRVMSLVEARPGEVWIGTVGQGVVVVDTASGQTRRLRHRAAAHASLLDDSVRGLYRDQSGLVWVACNGGVSRLDPRATAVLTVALSDGARSRRDFGALMPSADGRVWLGTMADGVEIADPETGSLQSIGVDPSQPETALPPDVVSSLAQAADGSVFIGSFRGLYRAPADGRSVARVRLAGRAPGAGVGPLLIDGPQLWVGGLTDGLWRLDVVSGSVRAVVADPARQLTDRRITALARGPAGELWIGTRNGLNRLQPARDALMQLPATSAPGGLAAGFVTSLLVDRQQRLWVATYGGGVHLMQAAPQDGDDVRFVRVTSAEGLPDDNVNALAEDAGGRIWASTDNGLAVIDPQTMRARPLRRAEGVVYASYWTGAVARTAAGELLFGAAGGLTAVRPELLQLWTHRPQVVPTSVQIGGHAVAVPGDGTLNVPANANSLVVEYAALDYSAPERNRYAHQLEGFDADWVATDATRRRAAYTNLPPGDYRLRLRGTNRDGADAAGERVLPVHVQAAWHQTAAFRVALALTALALLFAVVQGRTRALRARRQELQRLVDERTAELSAMSRALTEKSQALELNSRALEEKSRVLERASISDPLTGLHNRRFLTEQIDGLLASSLRRGQDASAARAASKSAAAVATAAADTDTLFFLIDADHFKSVNDERGHAAGDTVLVQLAQRLQAAMRESDFVVRWGGEEFLAVARDTDRARADELAERIRVGVADTPFRLDDGQQVAMTCSVGVAAWPFVPAQPQALDWQGVVKLADTALFMAKRLGRNAWVGLHAGPAARADELLAHALSDAPAALRSGELRASSSQPIETLAETVART